MFSGFVIIISLNIKSKKYFMIKGFTAIKELISRSSAFQWRQIIFEERNTKLVFFLLLRLCVIWKFGFVSIQSFLKQTEMQHEWNCHLNYAKRCNSQSDVIMLEVRSAWYIYIYIFSLTKATKITFVERKPIYASVYRSNELFKLYYILSSFHCKSVAVVVVMVQYCTKQ